MTIGINQLVSGMGLNIDGEIYLVMEYQHVKPGKGSAFCRVKLKNIKTDAVLERTFRTADKLEDIPLEEHEMEFLYSAGNIYHFMNHETYEEVEVSLERLGGSEKFLLENLAVTGFMYENKALRVVLPNFIEAEIVEAEPGIKGDSSRAGTKAAKIQTGAVIQVPLFISQGDWIKIDTRSGQYVERIQK
ncbi:MAG: elongation factor P [Candidatus Omnitrophota bacterium]